MRLLTALLILLSGFVAEAQQVENPLFGQAGEFSDQATEKATYFLIDASGSMADRNAEGIVSRILAKIHANDASAPVSRTYFRAKDGAACWNAIEIGQIEPAAESKASSIAYENDFTPMGEALKGALLSAVERGGPADIIIISDEDPTPGCGIDICSVAEAYLPLKNISVISIQVDPQSPAHHDRIGCIEAAQNHTRNDALGLFVDHPLEPANSQVEPNDWQSASSLARWYWFLVLIFASAGFVCLSLRFGERTAQYHGEIARIQKQRRADDGTSEGSESDESIGFFEPEEKSPNLKIAWKVLLIIAGALALILLIVPYGDYLNSARGAAWFVLSSGFANAFAILATSPALFAAGQYWMYDQSKRTYYLVSDSADDERKRKAREKAEQLLVNYQTLRTSLDQIRLSSPWSIGKFRSRPYEPTEADKSNVETAKKHLIELAKGEMVTDPFSPHVARETDYVKSISRTWIGFFSKSSLPALIEQLAEMSRLPERNRDNWLSLAVAIRSKNNRSISAKLTALLETGNA